MIINRSGTLPAWAQLRDRILSIIMWIVYLYFIRYVFIDLYLFTKEAVDWVFLSDARPDMPTMFRFVRLLGLYSIFVVLSGVVLIGWAVYNKRRFGGADQRKPMPAVTPDDLAQFFQISVDTVIEWQNSRSVTLGHDALGVLLMGSLTYGPPAAIAGMGPKKAKRKVG